jgi:glutathione peroxidase
MSVLSTLRMYVRRTPKLSKPTDIYEHRVNLLDGGELDLESLRGKPTLFVNTASKCGYTPQYEGLQTLYERYRDRGLQVVGSPSADFADQEYDNAEEIGDFCKKNYGVSFPLFSKLVTKAGPEQSPIYGYLGKTGSLPSWNFAKYVVDKHGKVVQFFNSKVTPDAPELRAAIDKALAAN